MHIKILRSHEKLLFLIIAAIVIASCHKEETLHPYKWETTESGFDSVAMLIEHQFNEFYPSDSIRRNISVLDSLAETGEKNLNSEAFEGEILACKNIVANRKERLFSENSKGGNVAQ